MAIVAPRNFQVNKGNFQVNKGNFQVHQVTLAGKTYYDTTYIN